MNRFIVMITFDFIPNRFDWNPEENDHRLCPNDRNKNRMTPAKNPKNSIECVEVQVFSIRVCREMDNHSMTIQQQNDVHGFYSYTLVIYPLGKFIIK